jgi:hypothetical protein
MPPRGAGARARLVAILVAGLALTACVDAPAPTPSPSGSVTSTPSPSPTATLTPTPTAVPSATPTPPPPQPSDPPPSRVVGVTAQTGGGSGEVLLRWTQNPEDDVVSYIVLRSLTPGGSATQIGTVTRDQVLEFEYVPFVDNDATVAYYRIRAVDAAGQRGPRSAEVCGASPGHSCETGI